MAACSTRLTTPAIHLWWVAKFWWRRYQTNHRWKHIAATGPNVEILRILLIRGASVHIRNNAGRTPLFLSANTGLEGHVSLLKRSGAHIHTDEVSIAKLHAQRSPDLWSMAGVTSPWAEDWECCKYGEYIPSNVKAQNFRVELIVAHALSLESQKIVVIATFYLCSSPQCGHGSDKTPRWRCKACHTCPGLFRLYVWKVWGPSSTLMAAGKTYWDSVRRSVSKVLDAKTSVASCG